MLSQNQAMHARLTSKGQVITVVRIWFQVSNGQEPIFPKAELNNLSPEGKRLGVHQLFLARDVDSECLDTAVRTGVWN